MDEYHWPHPAGVTAVNALLQLPATGFEQDWEIELADDARITEFLEARESDVLNLEGRSALVLLLLISVERLEGVMCSEEERVRSAIHSDPEILRRMRSYWSRDDNADATVQRLIS